LHRRSFDTCRDHPRLPLKQTHGAPIIGIDRDDRIT